MLDQEPGAPGDLWQAPTSLRASASSPSQQRVSISKAPLEHWLRCCGFPELGKGTPQRCLSPSPGCLVHGEGAGCPHFGSPLLFLDSAQRNPDKQYTRLSRKELAAREGQPDQEEAAQPAPLPHSLSLRGQTRAEAVGSPRDGPGQGRHSFIHPSRLGLVSHQGELFKSNLSPACWYRSPRLAQQKGQPLCHPRTPAHAHLFFLPDVRFLPRAA